MSLIRTGDKVQVIAGNNKGESGKVLQVIREKNQVIVEGVNVRVKHERVRQTENGTVGGIVEKEFPIHTSNVAYLDPKTSKPCRLGVVVGEDGTKRRVTRGSNSSNSTIDE